MNHFSYSNKVLWANFNMFCHLFFPDCTVQRSGKAGMTKRNIKQQTNSMNVYSSFSFRNLSIVHFDAVSFDVFLCQSVLFKDVI